MKKLTLPAALAVALLAPAIVRADSNAYDFCTTGLSLNFCGSVVTTATANPIGGTDLSLVVINAASESPQSEFTVIGIDDAATRARPDGDQCSGTFERLYRCDSIPVIISFSAAALTYALVTSGSPTSSGNAVNDVIVPTTINPEPATIALVASGLLGLGGPLSRWRRRRNS